MEYELNKDYILEMVNVDKHFHGVHALKGCSFNLKAGEVHALIGENGAGKSTMMKILTGIHQLDAGTIFYVGADTHFKSPKDAQSMGISMVHQELNLINHLTVAQNIFIGRESDNLFLNDKFINKKAEALLKRLNINIKPDEIVKNLTVGSQQMIEIAKAISFDAKVIIFDEPTATLAETEIEELFEVMRELKAKGVGMVYISHRMDEIKAITDRVTIMRDGEYICTRNTSEITTEEIIGLMVGRIIYEEPKQKSNVPDDAEVVLKVENLTSKDVKNISFELKKGEILGFAGLMGAGRTEVARLIFGADKKISGNIYKNGKLVNINSPNDAVECGIGYLSEDRKQFGLAVSMTVAENSVMASLDNYINFGIINENKIKSDTKEYIEKINIKTPSENQIVKNLSGGNQQKVVIAKWLLRDCDVLIFDEPTRGIDVGAKSEIYKLMNALVKEGKSIIMISSELPELLRMSDRVFVMCEGKHTGTLDIDKADQHEIMRYATMRNMEAQNA